MTNWFPLAQTVGPTAETTSNGTTAPAAAPATTGAGQPGATTTTADGTTTKSDKQADTQPQGGLLQNLGSFLPFILIFVVLYFLLFRGNRKEEKQRKAMISQMKKGDEVMTIGGLVGKIIEVKDDRVVLKIDESNNVKATYLKSAIQKVLIAEEKK